MTKIEKLVGGNVWKAVRGLHGLETAARNLRMELERSQGAMSLSVLIGMVAEEWGVTIEAIHSRDRHSDVAMARQVAMVLTRECFKSSLSEVGRMFSRDHGTVLHAERAVRAACETTQSIARRVDRLRSLLRVTPAVVVPGDPLLVQRPMAIAA